MNSASLTVALRMSIPDWSYSEEYYASLLEPCGLEIRTDPVKGKGLFATRAIESGDAVLCETALCCSQNLDDVNSGIPVCATCLRSVEQPADIVTRIAGAKCAGSLPSKFAAPNPPPTHCRKFKGLDGCKTVYCSQACESKGWDQFHCVTCTSVLKDTSAAALKAFMAYNWVQGGIDLSDTHWLALRFLAFFFARRRQGLPLETAWAPIAQLIRAPIEKFAFTYLVVDEYETEVMKSDKESKSSKVKRRWEHFLKYKENQAADPIAQFANREAYSKSQMITAALSLMRDIFVMTAEEVEYVNATRWSELLGAVLLNGQERSPNSPFFEVREANRKAFGDFITAMRSVGVNHRDFDTSSRGQGIYPVGACFNHSCSPNIQVSYVQRNDETLLVHALRDIAAGEELCISYIDENARVEERQQHLFEHYLFTCSCLKCTRDLAALARE